MVSVTCYLRSFDFGEYLEGVFTLTRGVFVYQTPSSSVIFLPLPSLEDRLIYYRVLNVMISMNGAKGDTSNKDIN